MCLGVNRIEVSKCADASTNVCICVFEGVGVEKVSVLDSGVNEVMRFLRLTVTPPLHTYTRTFSFSEG